MKRYPEIDILRTIAILMMIIYHTAYDLTVFYGWNIRMTEGLWLIWQRMTAGLFLLLVGISAAISYGKSVTWHKQMHRLLRVGLAALLVTVATYAINPETYVRFGILHLIAVSAVLLPFFKRLRTWAIIPGILMIALGKIVQSIIVSNPMLLPLGIRYAGFKSVDYFPLIPWFGVILIGYGVGWMYVYGLQVAGYRLPEKTMMTPKISLITFPGRHALFFYLIHQPMILGILWLILGKT